MLVLNKLGRTQWIGTRGGTSRKQMAEPRASRKNGLNFRKTLITNDE